MIRRPNPAQLADFDQHLKQIEADIVEWVRQYRDAIAQGIPDVNAGAALLKIIEIEKPDRMGHAAALVCAIRYIALKTDGGPRKRPDDPDDDAWLAQQW